MDGDQSGLAVSATASGQGKPSTKGVWGVLWTCHLWFVPGMSPPFAFSSSSGLVGTRVLLGVPFIKLAARCGGCGLLCQWVPMGCGWPIGVGAVCVLTLGMLVRKGGSLGRLRTFWPDI